MTIATIDAAVLDRLFIGPNGEVICNRHHPVARGRPASDFKFRRLNAAEIAYWRGFVASRYGASASPCEGCR